MTVRILNVYGAAGGVGTSTVATLLAIRAKGAAIGDDCVALSGQPVNPDAVSVASFVPADGTCETLVVDQGVIAPLEWPKNGVNVLVIRNDYVTLRKAVHLIGGHGDIAPREFDHIVLVHDSSRAIGHRDIERAIGKPVIVLPIDPAIARTIDAGLLGSRTPKAATVLDVIK